MSDTPPESSPAPQKPKERANRLSLLEEAGKARARLLGDQAERAMRSGDAVALEAAWLAGWSPYRISDATAKEVLKTNSEAILEWMRERQAPWVSEHLLFNRNEDPMFYYEETAKRWSSGQFEQKIPWLEASPTARKWLLSRFDEDYAAQAIRRPQPFFCALFPKPARLAHPISSFSEHWIGAFLASPGAKALFANPKQEIPFQSSTSSKPGRPKTPFFTPESLLACIALHLAKEARANPEALALYEEGFEVLARFAKAHQVGADDLPARRLWLGALCGAGTAGFLSLTRQIAPFLEPWALLNLAGPAQAFGGACEKKSFASQTLQLRALRDSFLELGQKASASTGLSLYQMSAENLSGSALEQREKNNPLLPMLLSFEGSCARFLSERWRKEIDEALQTPCAIRETFQLAAPSRIFSIQEQALAKAEPAQWARLRKHFESLAQGSAKKAGLLPLPDNLRAVFFAPPFERFAHRALPPKADYELTGCEDAIKRIKKGKSFTLSARWPLDFGHALIQAGGNPEALRALMGAGKTQERLELIGAVGGLPSAFSAPDLAKLQELALREALPEAQRAPSRMKL